MNNKLEKNYEISLSMCDNTEHLSIYNIFAMFMDIATEHAKNIKASTKDLGEDMFWVTVRTKVQILRRPVVYDKITLATWPEKPSRVRANRHYIISDENGVLIKGKNEWTVVNIATGKLQRVSEIYPAELEFCEDISIEENYARISDDFSDAQTVCDYTIRSTDIDLVQHMNNAAYIRALIGTINTKDLQEHPIKDIEIVYKSQSYEGETLTIKRRVTENAEEYGMLKADSTVCATVRIVRE